MPSDPVGYVLGRVVRASGQSVRVVAEEDYAVTLWLFLQMEEDARIARLIARTDRLDLAALMALASHAPKELDRVRRDLLSDIRGDGEVIRVKERSAMDQLKHIYRRRPSALHGEVSHG